MFTVPFSLPNCLTCPIRGGHLSTELGADHASLLAGLCCLGGSSCGRGSSWSSAGVGSGGATGHLNSDDTTEWTSTGWVNDLDKADIRLASDGTGAAHASGHGGLEWVVLVDVGSTLHETHANKHAGHKTALLGGGDVTPGTWDLLGDGHLGTGGESPSSGRIADGGIWAGSVSGDDVDSSRDGSSVGDLREGGAGLSHDGGHARESVGAGLGLSETVRGGLFAIEDGGVDFGLLVGSCTWDHSSLDTETSSVSTGVTGLLYVSEIYRRDGMWMLTMTAILPWAATSGDAARAKRNAFVNMFA
jgi:hypothetical protein